MMLLTNCLLFETTVRFLKISVDFLMETIFTGKKLAIRIGGKDHTHVL